MTIASRTTWNSDLPTHVKGNTRWALDGCIHSSIISKFLSEPTSAPVVRRIRTRCASLEGPCATRMEVKSACPARLCSLNHFTSFAAELQVTLCDTPLTGPHVHSTDRLRRFCSRRLGAPKDPQHQFAMVVQLALQRPLGHRSHPYGVD